MTTIVIDGQAWAKREQVAHLLSHTLRCPIVATDELALRATQMGYNGEELAERTEQPYGLLRRLTDYMAYAGVGTPAHSGLGVIYLSRDASILPLDASRMRGLLARLLEDETNRLSVVVGCGAQGALRTNPNVLKVLLVAAEDVRIQCAALEMEASPGEAREQIRKVDGGRRAFLKHLYGLSWDDPAIYDLVLDTGILENDEVVKLILKKMGDAPRFAGKDATLEAVG